MKGAATRHERPGGSVAGTRRALRETLAVDRGLLAPVVGAVTAAPVVALYAVGQALSNPTSAIAMAIGAELIAIVSLIAAPRLSVAWALLDALAMGVAVFAGVVSVSTPWLHVSLLVAWCFGAGLVVVLGLTAGAIGSQAIIAYVVFGRFSGSASSAGHLAAYVIVGAVVEVAALLVLRAPPTLREQRARLADACDAVAGLARAPASSNAIATLVVLDDAERILAAPSLFGRTDVGDLRGVLDQLRRVRLELTTIAGLRQRLLQRPPAGVEDLRRAREAVADVLVELAGAVRTRVAPSWSAATSTLEAALARLEDHVEPVDPVLVGQYVTHLGAIGGQLRSMRHLTVDLARDNARTAWRVGRPTWQRADATDWRGELTLLRDALRSWSPALRHAVRLAVAVPAAVLIATWLSLPRGYWVAFSVAVILKPDYSTLLRRGVGRVVGTALGATLAALVVSLLHPNAAATTVLIGLSAWAAFTTWSASFVLGVGFITALVLVILSTSSEPVTTAADRLLDVVIGGVIAFAVYLAWPTPPRAGVVDAERDLFSALGDYLAATMRLVSSQPVDGDHLVELSRHARVAWARTEAAVGRSVEEPGATRVNPAEGRSLLTVGLRILRATHALRTEAERGARSAPNQALSDLGWDFARALGRISAHFEDREPGPPVALRERYRAAKRHLDADEVAPTIASHLDELVNAINTGAHLAGLETMTPTD